MKEIKLNRKCKTIEEHEDFCDFLRENYKILVIQSTGLTIDRFKREYENFSNWECYREYLEI